VKARQEKKKANPKIFLGLYGAQMTHMPVGKVIYVTYFGARTRLQRTGEGALDYAIEGTNGRSWFK